MTTEKQICLVLSINHISCKTHDILQEWCSLHQGTQSESIVFDYGYGYVFVWVPDEWDFDNEMKVKYMGIPDGCPDLIEVLKFAARSECQMLKIDADGDSIDQLPKFEW